MRGRAFARSRACSDSRIRRSSTGSEGSIGLSSREPRTKLAGRAHAAVHLAGPCYPVRRSGQVAQLEEHGSEEPGVGGSIPSLATNSGEQPPNLPADEEPGTPTTALARGRGLLTATSLGGSPPGTLYQPFRVATPSRRLMTSDSRYRRCPPRVLMELSLPAFAQRVTVFGSTRKSAATSAGVRSASPDDWSSFMDFS